MHPAQRLDRVLDVALGVGRREGEREQLGAGPFRDRERRLVGKPLAVGGQLVDREEVDAGADVLVAGNFVFSSADPKGIISQLKRMG